jgi:hypothetical protein
MHTCLQCSKAYDMCIMSVKCKRSEKYSIKGEGRVSVGIQVSQTGAMEYLRELGNLTIQMSNVFLFLSIFVVWGLNSC